MGNIMSKAQFFPWLEKSGYSYYYNQKQHRFMVRGKGCYIMAVEMNNNQVALIKQNLEVIL
ncbi:MAG: hypothetical protein ACYDEI_00030 [Erysipelotrichaceae bacterium]